VTDYPKTAIVLLSCSDFRALEISLACHMKYAPEGVDFYVLQNCRGSFSAERTLEVANRFANRYPNRIEVRTNLAPDYSYRNIRKLLNRPKLKKYDLICKVDDDCFPIAEHWFQALHDTYAKGVARDGDRFAYATPLINNNTWGFQETLSVMSLEKRFFKEIASEHWAGPNAKKRVVPADKIDVGACGSIWRNPHFARWLHRETTLQPGKFAAACTGLNPVPVPNDTRYSIGCILFRRTLWNDIASGKNQDDEGMLFDFVTKNDMTVDCARAAPFVHLNYFSQRDENADLIEAASEVYQDYCAPPYPISGFPSKAHEVSARLEALEKKLQEEGKASTVLKGGMYTR